MLGNNETVKGGGKHRPPESNYDGWMPTEAWLFVTKHALTFQLNGPEDLDVPGWKLCHYDPAMPHALTTNLSRTEDLDAGWTFTINVCNDACWMGLGCF